jgi:hypothetical protein
LKSLHTSFKTRSDALGWRRRRFSEGQAFQFFGGGKRLANRLSFVFFVD